jgi:hypothetical protein
MQNSTNELKSDIVLISDFGRSAQGWLSYMLCYILNARYIEPYNLLSGEKFTSSSIIESNTRGGIPGRSKTSYSLIVKTHNPPSKNKFNLTRAVIYLTRDPRDVSISYYYLALSWIKSGNLSVAAISNALPVIRNFMVAYRWRRHYINWSNVEKMHVRYEDLRADTHGSLRKILEYLEVFEISDELIYEAISIFGFENTYGRKRGVEDKSNPEARKGVIGDYRNHFSILTNRLFWMVCGKQAESAGYRLDGSTTIEPNQ